MRIKKLTICGPISVNKNTILHPVNANGVTNVFAYLEKLYKCYDTQTVRKQ